MRAIFKGEELVLIPDSAEEERAISDWKSDRFNHVLKVSRNDGSGIMLKDLGPLEEACQEPINVTSQSPDESIRLISNFAATPFELDGRRYASVESFWQSLKFSNGLERRKVAEMAGPAARHMGEKQGYGLTLNYEGQSVAVGTWAHWELMKRACHAKFTQNADARDALIGTKERPLTHKTRHDSRSIPGVIMAEIWMKLRRDLAKLPAETTGE